VAGHCKTKEKAEKRNHEVTEISRRRTMRKKNKNKTKRRKERKNRQRTGRRRIILKKHIKIKNKNNSTTSRNIHNPKCSDETCE